MRREWQYGPLQAVTAKELYQMERKVSCPDLSEFTTSGESTCKGENVTISGGTDSRYIAPKLVECGSLKALIRGGDGSPQDSPTGGEEFG